MKNPENPDRRDQRIPTEADWGDYRADLDQKWAHDHYCGHSNEQMQKYFRNSPIEAASDLQFMPEIPFRYYMLGYRDFVMSRNFGPFNAPDAASCFLRLVVHKLERGPQIYCGDHARTSSRAEVCRRAPGRISSGPENLRQLPGKVREDSGLVRSL